MCGEHVNLVNVCPWLMGSSPHVQGTLICGSSPMRSTGIIPACAGNTHAVHVHAVMVGDHPRMCGEHVAPALVAQGGPGSSPHVRGTLCVGGARGVDFGIIPACAGNTGTPPQVPNVDWDHPRMCGEHPVICDLAHATIRANWGSSPHVRGTPEGSGERYRIPGIIPACAGNTRAVAGGGAARGDHPRMCGEHLRPRW